MDRLIPLVNRIQDALGGLEHHESIPFPRLAVVGSQSSGKSSVLESLVGRDFLPRGAGIVTRRPLILQLEHGPEGTEQGVFEHRATVFKDFSEIRREIELETDRLLGKKAEISSDPIKLKITSPHVLDITLIDLPGLTKVPVGNQPHNISDIIRNMVISYIKEPNSIILAVSAGNADLANSDALRIAREVDPTGERTIGVITKIDIMDKGTDALEMLSGNLYPLRLGYIGVICRSQEDIINNKQMSKHLEDETNFFYRHEKYKAIAYKMGTKHLSKVLNEVLKDHIKKTLPDFKKKINEMIRNADLELKTYGVPIQGNKDFQGVIFLNIVTTFCVLYSKILEGKNASAFDRELNGGARIRHNLFSKYFKSVMAVDPFDTVTEQDIRTAILNARGVKSNYIVPQDALEMLITVQIQKLYEPSVKALQEILELLKVFVRDIEINEYKQYPNLRPILIQIVESVLDSCYQPAKDFINDCIENEKAFINLDHPRLIPVEDARRRAETEYSDSAKARALETTGLAKLYKRQNKAPEIASEKETKDMFFTRNVVISYFNITKKNISDYVIKTIMTFLVKKSAEKIQTELLAQVYCKKNFDEILFEDPEIPEKRQKIIEFLAKLRNASGILDEIRDIEI